MSNKTVLLVIWMVVFMALICSCTVPADNSGSDASATTSSSVSETSTIEQVNAKKSSADNMKGHTSLGWWDDFTRFVYENKDAGSVKTLRADAGGCFVQDEGRGPYMRENSMVGSGQSVINAFHSLDLKASAWLEGQGDSRISIGAVHRNDDGTYEIDSRTGAAKLLANHWTWKSGDLSNNGGANEVIWMGVHSFVNEEPWCGDLIISKTDVITPTYPDGTPAIGYLKDASDPASAMVYDACSGKDINGNAIRFDEVGSCCSTEYGVKYDNGKGSKFQTTDFAMTKDTASPFWVSYNINAAKYMMEHGIDFFWIDNWNGWDNISSAPIKRAFGDWSEYGFKAYLKEHPELGVSDPDSFSITDYLRDKAKTFKPTCDVTNLYDSVWSDKRWLDDPVWLAYLCFKSDVNKEYNTTLYAGIKEAAKTLGLEPDSIGIGTNDFPYLTFGAFDCDTIDIVHTEYQNTFNIGSGSVTSGSPPFGYSGHTFNLLSNTGRSKNAVVWYYHDGSDTLATLYAYEALAYNCTLYGGGSTDTSIIKVNTTIEKTKEYFTGREIYSEIGVVLCPESEMTYLTPGLELGDNTTVAYISWCHAFDELNIPYRSVQMQKLEREIDMYSVVILPNVRSMEQSYIDRVLIPFLDNGGTLIITGSDSGMYKSIANAFVKNESPLLADLAKSYSGNGKIVYYETNPLNKYIKQQKNADEDLTLTLINDYLSAVYDLYNDLIKEERLNRLVKLRNFPESAVVTLNYNVDKNIFFCDLVNMQYDASTDKMTTAADIEATLRLPSTLWSKNLTVRLVSADGNRVKTVSDWTLDGEFITVPVDSFSFYTTIIISEETTD